MGILKDIYSKLREQWSPGRIILAMTALTATIAAPIGAFIATWTATHFPGLPTIDPNWVAGIFLTTTGTIITGVVVLGLKRLDGLMQYEKLVADPTTLTEEKVLKAAPGTPTGADLVTSP